MDRMMLLKPAKRKLRPVEQQPAITWMTVTLDALVSSTMTDRRRW